MRVLTPTAPSPAAPAAPARRLLGRLLALLVLLGSCVFAATSASAAPAPCSCERAETQDHVKAANAVFTGTVDQATAPSGSAANGLSGMVTVTVDRVYKGSMITTETVDVSTARAFGTCNDALKQGGRYVFFVESDEGLSATGCGGTARATAALVGQVTRLLGEGRLPVPQQSAPVEPAMTPVDTSRPTSLTRLAAPGVALVLIGLLGLGLVRRVGRRT